MLIVENDRSVVEQHLLAGRLRCPACRDGELRPWSRLPRRMVRHEDHEENLEPRRARCRNCGKTHVLLPDTCLAGRLNSAAVILRGLLLKAGGAGHRAVAAELGLPAGTVRGWLRRFAAVAEAVRVHMTIWAAFLDAAMPAVDPTGSSFADALESLGLAARACSLRLGRRPAASWATRLSAGQLLSNTNRPWPAPM